jgi:hypothetical protein
VQRGANLDDDAGLAGEVSAHGSGKKILSRRCVLAGAETGVFRHRRAHRGAMPAETLHRKALRSMKRVELGKSKRKSRINYFTRVGLHRQHLYVQ